MRIYPAHWRSRTLWTSGAAALLMVVSMLGVGGTSADEPAMPATFVEPPSLADKVAKGELPPVQERLPKVPAVADMAWPGQTVGKHGGDITLLMATPKDTRLMVVYGYARLVAYDPKLRAEAGRAAGVRGR